PGTGALARADSDSSDDELVGGKKKVGSVAGLPGLLGGEVAGAVGGSGGAVANLGRVKDRQALADNDPLGVDQNVNFDSVGGLQGHIDKLKEMVSLPLLYPEIFQKFHIVPPRGVLFHGPPGTGKTLLARALASSLSSSEGKKVTFYMRKGADALSKWVGEAERQLRLLFEDARKNQPSIIFFDEIDGLAPVRSSKQEQIHASIVSTLLALMDGMDGRGQVIVIGATNRPDSVDPALRRPGRFDREFYFPLPNTEGRRKIIDIHTRGWQPAVSDELKDTLAEITKGYGGADLRALCTEAALNAVQRRYPQIYRSDRKLMIDPAQIHITPRDFMISTRNIVPSSERSSSSAASPLPPVIEPLLKKTLQSLQAELHRRFPRSKALTALEEAEFQQPADQSFHTEILQRAFQESRVHRPCLLIRAEPGQGAGYVGAALLHHLEGVSVQSFNLPTLLGDSTRTPEAVMVQMIGEARRRKPSVIYLPDFAQWNDALSSAASATFSALIRSLKPSDPILLLGLLEQPQASLRGVSRTSFALKQQFGFSGHCDFHLANPSDLERRTFFQALAGYLRMAPTDLQDPAFRKKRKVEELPAAPVDEVVENAKGPSEGDLKATKKRDRQTLNLLKIRIQPIMDQIKKNYRRFRAPVIDEHQITYLFEDHDPSIVTSDLPIEHRAQFRPFEKDVDKHGVPGLREVASGKFFYNLDITTIERRLSNGYYKRPCDFLADIKRIAKDARQCSDYDRQIKGNELLANVEVDIGAFEATDPAFVAECEAVRVREMERERIAREKAQMAEQQDPLLFHLQQPQGLAGPANRSDGQAGAQGELNHEAVPAPAANDGLNDQSSAQIVLAESFADGSQRPPLHASDHSTPTKPVAGVATANGHPSSQIGVARNDSTLSGFEADADVQMSNTDDSGGSSSLGPSAQPRPFESHTAPSQALQREEGVLPLSQDKPLTSMVSGSQHQEYQNDASTTQTGTGTATGTGTGTGTDRKNSYTNSGPSKEFGSLEREQDQEPGQPQSLSHGTMPPPPPPPPPPNQQQQGHPPPISPGDNSRPNFELFPARAADDADLPNTQAGDNQPWSFPNAASPSGGRAFAEFSNPSTADSQGPSRSLYNNPSSIREYDSGVSGSLLQFGNSNSGSHAQVGTSPRAPAHSTTTARNHVACASAGKLKLSDGALDRLLDMLVWRTTNWTVEQLEALHAHLVQCIWERRGEWDRDVVITAVNKRFEEVVREMAEAQQAQVQAQAQQGQSEPGSIPLFTAR
ncbi:hypothetical protein KEM52_004432, partial [Ascosphaera acerosa]